MERIEDTILRNLLYNEEYARKTLPFLKDEYFSQFTDKAIFQELKEYFQKYSNPPSKEALIIELNDRNDLTEEHFSSATELLNDVEKTKENGKTTEDFSWLVERSEKFCQDNQTKDERQYAVAMKFGDLSLRAKLNYIFFWVNLVVAFFLAYHGSMMCFLNLAVAFFCWLAYKFQNRMEKMNEEQKKP